MENTWMLFLLVVCSTAVYAEGPVYNFNFGSSNTESGMTPVLEKSTPKVLTKSDYTFRRLGFEVGKGEITDGSNHDLGEAVLDLNGVESYHLVLSYALNKNIALRLGYKSYFVFEQQAENLEFYGKGGLLGIEYRSSGSKWFKYILGLDFSYMYTGEAVLSSSYVVMDSVERIQFMARMGPQFRLGRFFINGLLTVSYTKTNINHGNGDYWSNEGDLSPGFSTSVGIMF